MVVVSGEYIFCIVDVLFDILDKEMCDEWGFEEYGFQKIEIGGEKFWFYKLMFI